MLLDHAPIDGHKKMLSLKAPQIVANDMGFTAICHCQSVAPFFASAQNTIAWLLLRIFFAIAKRSIFDSHFFNTERTLV